MKEDKKTITFFPRAEMCLMFLTRLIPISHPVYAQRDVIGS